MGRRPIGETAMTDAERQRRRRERLASSPKHETAERRREAAPIDVSTLSISAQKKLDIAIRQETRRLAQQFEADVSARVKADLETTIARLKIREADADRIIKARRGVMSKADWKTIRNCLHPDRQIGDKGKKEAEHAFNLWNTLEIVLMDEKQRPTDLEPLPRTYEDLMAAKRAATEARRRKRANSGSEVTRR